MHSRRKNHIFVISVHAYLTFNKSLIVTLYIDREDVLACKSHNYITRVLKVNIQRKGLNNC